jgi:hypothetical protein
VSSTTVSLHRFSLSHKSYRGRLPKAHQTYSSLPGHYIPHGWTSLGCYMHYRAMKIHSQMSIPRDREWIHVLLDFLKAYIVDMSQEFVVQNNEKTYMSDIIDSLRIAASELQSGQKEPRSSNSFALNIFSQILHTMNTLQSLFECVLQTQCQLKRKTDLRWMSAFGIVFHLLVDLRMLICLR